MALFSDVNLTFGGGMPSVSDEAGLGGLGDLGAEWSATPQGKIYTYPDGSQCMVAMDLCIPLEPCPAPYVHRDDPGYNPMACSPAPGDPMVCAAGYYKIGTSCLLIERGATVFIRIPAGMALPSWIDPASGIQVVNGYGQDGQVDGTNGRVWYAGSVIGKSAQWIWDIAHDVLRYFPGDPKTGGCTGEPWPLVSAVNGSGWLSPCVNFAEHDKAPSADLKRYYDWLVAATTASHGAARAQSLKDGREPFMIVGGGWPMLGDTSFATWSSGAETPISRPAVVDGRDGDWVLSNYRVFYGASTGGKIKIVYHPYFDKDFSIGISLADLWLSVIFPPYALNKIAIGLLGPIYDEIKNIVCGSAGQTAAAVADQKYPGAKVAHALACAALGTPVPGGGGTAQTQESSGAMPWILTGLGVFVAGGLALLALKRRKK